MDGQWQIGCKTADEYARVAGEAAKLIRLVDENAKFIFCGSSHPYMESFGSWEKTVLSKCFDYVDYISLHFYFGNPDNRTPDYLASSIKMNKFINDVRGFIEDVKKEKKSDNGISISFDEWNVWFHSNEHDSEEKPWQIAPRLLEDHYNFEDALVVGSLLITLIQNSDIVKIACLAQLVNVIAPIMVEPEGLFLQTTYYPFMHASVYGRGTALKVNTLCASYDTDEAKDVPYLLSAAVKNDDGIITAFILNRSLDCDITTQLNVPKEYNLIKHIELYHDDLKAVNSLENKDCVTPREVSVDNSGFVTLKKHSWNVLIFHR
jgi:alpha-N-arabinofuranosidase